MEAAATAEAGAFRLVGIDMGLEPEPGGGKGEHAAELTAAQDADRAPWG